MFFKNFLKKNLDKSTLNRKVYTLILYFILFNIGSNFIGYLMYLFCNDMVFLYVVFHRENSFAIIQPYSSEWYLGMYIFFFWFVNKYIFVYSTIFDMCLFILNIVIVNGYLFGLFVLNYYQYNLVYYNTALLMSSKFIEELILLYYVSFEYIINIITEYDFFDEFFLFLNGLISYFYCYFFINCKSIIISYNFFEILSLIIKLIYYYFFNNNIIGLYKFFDLLSLFVNIIYYYFFDNNIIGSYKLFNLVISAFYVLYYDQLLEIYFRITIIITSSSNEFVYLFFFLHKFFTAFFWCDLFNFVYIYIVEVIKNLNSEIFSCVFQVAYKMSKFLLYLEYNDFSLVIERLLDLIVFNSYIFDYLFCSFYFIDICYYLFKIYSVYGIFFNFLISVFLINFVIILLFGIYIGIWGLISFLVINFLISGICIFILLINFFQLKCFVIIEYNIFLLNFLFTNVKINFFCDFVTLLMIFIIISISILVHFYSILYMRFDPQLLRFLSLLSLFTFCMIILVSSGNIVLMFFGWEGVGLCSYFLINFWFTRLQANKAALKAMLINRFGDVSFLAFIALYYYIFKSFDYLIGYCLSITYIYSYITIYSFSVHLFSLLAIFLLIAVIGKSAQLGLHTWLPDAMEGPTPVSALIHAATMVTAGIFIMIRFSFIFNLSMINFLIVLIGGLTALFGSVVAVLQYDIKKVIAYSTCSQLGYMVVACGLFRYDLALFHLLNHAFFKALLFLSAGVILHSLYDEQDMRRLGFLIKFMPFIYFCMFVASYALLGLPFLSGFFSKDLILEINGSSFNILLFWIYFIIVMAAFFTAFYSFRLIWLIFFNLLNGPYFYYKKFHVVNFVYKIIFFILVIFSIFSGYFFKEIFIGFGAFKVNLFSVFFVQKFSCFFLYEYNYFFYRIFPFLVSLVGLMLSYLWIYVYNFTLVRFFYLVKNFFLRKFYIDLLYNYFIIKYMLFLSYFVFYRELDKNFFEFLGVSNIYLSVFEYINKYYEIFGTYIYMYIIFLISSFLITIYLFIFFGCFDIELLILFFIYLIILKIYKKKEEKEER